MELKFICFSEDGLALAEKIREGMIYHEVEIVYKGKKEIPGVQREEQSLWRICKEAFSWHIGLCFVSAAGIAVREISPFVHDKLTDPPVLAMDERGTSVIPLLSGHVGGANALAYEIALIIGAEPVITTASESRRAAGTDGGSYVLGIGCRRGKQAEQIEETVSDALALADISMDQISLVCSVDFKRDEPGLLAFAEDHYKTFLTFSVDALIRVEGQYTGSDFVLAYTGVDNVCERAAMAGAGGHGKIVVHKYACDGVTVAVAERP